jgi:hypothetical protein
MSKQLSCKDRIEDEYRRADDYIELMFKVLDNYEFDEDDEDDKKQLQEIEDDGIDEGSIHEYAAGTSMEKLLTIVLSGGGPSSHIEAIIDEDGYVKSATYHFLDWFDGATRKISEDSAMFKYVQWEAERYM